MHRVHLVKVGHIFFQNISKEYFCGLVRFYSYLDLFKYLLTYMEYSVFKGFMFLTVLKVVLCVIQVHTLCRFSMFQEYLL